jgi:transcriptional regulator with XRE-family HTH domain
MGVANNRRRWYLRQWRELRKAQSGKVGAFTQADLGARAGYTQGQSSQWEDNANYTHDNLGDLAGALGITIYELMFVDPTLSGGDDPARIFLDIPDAQKPTAIKVLKAMRGGG